VSRDPGSLRADWLTALRGYLALSLGLHLLWESAQLPLYTVWTSGTASARAFTVAHCTLGDVAIAGMTLLSALAILGSHAWPLQRTGQVLVLSVVFGVAYTIYSEWYNTGVRQSWAYSPLMPVLPLTGTGLSPLLQWLIVPSLALSLATRRRKNAMASA